ncbi:LytR C-terminal domain-containing protein [Mycobacterium intermedium]
MVLLFLGTIFLLLGWQALSSSGKSDDESPPPSAVTTTTSPTTTSKPPAKQAEVHIYNISGQDGLAARTKDQLVAAGFKVVNVDDLQVPDVTVTTVYWADEAERATAEEVGKALHAPVEKRIPELSEQPAGVIVLVTG